MDITETSEELAATFADQVPDLVFATGPASYTYQFGSRGVLDPLIRASWLVPGTLFSHDATTLALRGGELLGIEIGFTDPGFHARADALAPIWPDPADLDEADRGHLRGIGRRLHQCRWLNPAIPPDVYYIHALAVTDAHRGTGVGAALLRQALERAQRSGMDGLQLDVLSDNPAVDFYLANGLEVLVESKAPIPFANGVPTELRMGIRFR
ncbi:MAG: GNAT family N-acetyltransferase [Actinomycetota bacterium]